MILASESSLKEYSTKGLWGKKTLNRILKEKARKDPGREFFIDPLNKTDLIGIEPERLTYGDVERIVDVLATNFIHLGLEKDDIVVIQLPNTVELLLSYLALWRIGAIASPVPIQWRAHEVDFVLRLTQAKAFITLEEFHGFKHLQLAKELRNKHASLKHIISLPQLKEMCRGGIDQQRLGSNHVDANDIVTVCYTSGTEAEPKACPLSHNNWIFEANILSQACLVDEGCTLIMPAPIVNLTGIVSIIFTIIHHATLVLHHPFDPIVYMTQLVEEKVNFGAAVPAMLVMLLKYPDIEKFDMSNIRSFLTGSAPPAAWTLREFKERWDIEVINGWGQNECTALGANPLDLPNPELRAEHFPWWGSPGFKSSIKGVEAIETKIVDMETGQPLTRVGAVGELLYRGPNVMSGYFRQPDITKASFEDDGFFHTGDLFQIKSDNLIGFFDRKKDIIIRGGQNISAAEVENIVKAHPAVLDAAAVDMPDKRIGERLCVYIVSQPGENVTLEDIKTFMKDRDVAVYKLPERLEIIDEIPRNPVGKAVKAPLREDIRQKVQSQEYGALYSV